MQYVLWQIYKLYRLCFCLEIPDDLTCTDELDFLNKETELGYSTLYKELLNIISPDQRPDNKIHQIQGLQKCARLTYLSLAHNSIEKIEGLDNLPIHYLSLVSNINPSCCNTEYHGMPGYQLAYWMLAFYKQLATCNFKS